MLYLEYGHLRHRYTGNLIAMWHTKPNFGIVINAIYYTYLSKMYFCMNEIPGQFRFIPRIYYPYCHILFLTDWAIRKTSLTPQALLLHKPSLTHTLSSSLYTKESNRKERTPLQFGLQMQSSIIFLPYILIWPYFPRIFPFRIPCFSFSPRVFYSIWAKGQWIFFFILSE